MTTTRCGAPVGDDALVAYWLGELDESAEASLELHLLACGDCSERTHQQPVEPAKHPGDTDHLHLAARPQATRSRVDDLDAHQSDGFVVVVAVVWKYFSKTSSAAGAAAVPP